MSDDHVCYMKMTAEEEATKLLRKRKKKNNENKAVKKWIFFDFECTQDERIQCNEGYQPQHHIVYGKCNQSDCHTNSCQQGYFPKKMSVCTNCHRPSCGSFRHVLNLCVVHKVCEKYIGEDEIDKYSFCNVCQYKERIFKGPNTRDEFFKLLFSEENEETRIFCHNFRGYDSYPIVSYMYENAILPEVIMNGSKFMSIKVPHLKMKFIDYEFHPNGSLQNSKSFQSFRVGQRILSLSLQQKRESEEYP